MKYWKKERKYLIENGISLDEDMANKIRLIAQVCGWHVDFIELHKFVEWFTILVLDTTGILKPHEKHREIEGPDGLTYRATYVGYERQNRLPYINFLDVRTGSDGLPYTDYENPISGGMNIDSATNLHKELGRVITYWQFIYEKN